jgi:drug/metabolite transporter (DMT)-like permease
MDPGQGRSRRPRLAATLVRRDALRLAAALLLPLGIRAVRWAHAVRPLSARLLGGVVLYGLLFVAVAQGAQFAALSVLPATAVSLVLSSIPAWVALMALAGRSERATVLQAGGIGLLSIGALLYFGPFEVAEGAAIGFVAAGVCVAAAALSSHLGRLLARHATVRLGGPVGLTATSMVVGGAALLGVGIAVEGWPVLATRSSTSMHCGEMRLAGPHQGDDSRHPTLGRRSVLPELKALMSVLPVRGSGVGPGPADSDQLRVGQERRRRART